MQQEWQQWKYINREKIKHIAGYEEKFVDEILSKISEITPDDVIPQYHFTDSKNGNRYIDFMILNEKKGYSLPIELDGYDKINNKGYPKFNDFLERQNDLIQRFGIVLRYTNKKAFQESHAVIQEIRNALNAQQNKLINEDTKQKQLQSLIEEHESKIAEYELKLKHKDKLETSKDFIEVEKAKNDLKNFKQIHVDKLVKVEKDLNFIKKIAIGGIASVIFILIGFVFYFKSDASLNNIVQPRALASSSHTIENSSDKGTFYIEAHQANNFTGKKQTVCGTVAQYKKFSKGVYLNYDHPYPEATFTVVIWNNNAHISQQLKDIENSTLCVQGLIEEYKGKPQMILSSLDQIM